MFSIIATMMTGISLGYLFRHKSFIQNTERTISLTIFLLLFIMGITIGSNDELIKNIGNFGWQAAVISVSATCGSVLAAWLVMKLFFHKDSAESVDTPHSVDTNDYITSKKPKR